MVLLPPTRPKGFYPPWSGLLAPFLSNKSLLSINAAPGLMEISRFPRGHRHGPHRYFVVRCVF